MRRALFLVALLCFLMPVLAVPQTRGNGTDASHDLSPSFRQAGLSALAAMERWKEKARHDAQGREPAPTFGKYLKISARESVSQAKLQATTEGDHEASTALESLFGKMTAWTDRLISERARLDATKAMNPDSVDKDDDLVGINGCGRALHALLLQGTHSDLPQCR